MNSMNEREREIEEKPKRDRAKLKIFINYKLMITI